MRLSLFKQAVFKKAVAFTLLLSFLLPLIGSSRGWSEEVRLNVIPATSPDPSSVSLSISAPLLGRSADASAISGEVIVDLWPTVLNPTSAQITGLQLLVDDEVSFQLGNFLTGRIGASAPAGSLALELFEAGPDGELRPQGGSDDAVAVFDQLENLVAVNGVVTTTVQPDPLDLAVVEPTLFDFEMIEVRTSRDVISLGASLETQLVTPIDAGPITLNLTFDVQGALLASGAVPAAEYTWERPALNASRYAYDDTQAWLRNGFDQTASLPSRIDQVIFEDAFTASAATIDLGETRAVDSVEFRGEYALADGVLEIESGNLLADSLVVQEDAEIRSQQEIQFEGTQLVLNGDADHVRIDQGALVGTGSAVSLTVADAASFVSVLSNQQPNDDVLSVATTADLNGELRLVSAIEGISGGEYVEPQQRGELHRMVLLRAGEIEADFDSVSYLDRPLEEHSDGTFRLVEEEGMFRTLLIGESEIAFENILAVAGDTNGDSQVDFADFLTVSTFFGMAGDWTQGDFDSTGSVDFADFLTVTANFGTVRPSSQASVPSPTGSMLALIGLPAMFALRRRHSRCRTKTGVSA